MQLIKMIKIDAQRFFTGFLYSFLFTSPAFAGQIYTYQNKHNGTTLLTNKANNDRALTRVKVTYYPDTNVHTYKNWGNSEAAVLPSYSKNKDAFNPIIQKAAQIHGVSEGLIKAVMHTESGFNIHARSPVGAQGLMQLMPATARRFNVNNAFDPQQNIMAGAEYLAWLLRRFNGNTQLALAGYNAGEGNVAKYGGIPPFKETQDYVQRVMSRLNNLYNSNNALISSSTSQVNTAHIASVAQANTVTESQATSASYSPRQIIVAADGTYTNAPTRTYSTENAVASAHIIISDY